MATTPLAVNTTLADFMERVRAQSSTISEQDSGIIKPELTNLIHSAIMNVRTMLGPLVDRWYTTKKDVAESGGLIDISALDIADLSGVLLYDSTHGAIPVVDDERFDTLRNIYGNTTISTEVLFARVRTEDGGALKIETRRGTTKATPGTMTITYKRNPIKATEKADKVDLPEKYIPVAEDVATLMIFRRLGKVPPADIDKRFMAFVQSEVAMNGIRMA